MFLADTTPPNVPITAVVNTLDGVTTVLVAFMFVCLVLPSMVRHRSQFYAALACLVGVIVVHTLMMMFDNSTTLLTFGGVGTGFLQVLALLLLVLSVGGLTVKQLAGDMAKAYEVIRRGETEKEVIIPIGDQSRRGRSGDTSPKVYKIDTSAAADSVDEDDDEKGIPLS